MQYFGGVNKVYYERCANGECPKITTPQQQNFSWFPQLILVLWLLVQILQNFLTVSI